MFILRNILTPLQDEFRDSRKGPERGTWFIYTLLAVITHFTSSRTSNLVRCLQTLFGLSLSSPFLYLHGFPQDTLGSPMDCSMVPHSAAYRQWASPAGPR